MKRFAMTAILLTGMAGNACMQAQSQKPDSLWNMYLQEVEVVSTRATSTTPVAFTNIGKEQLQKQNLGQDLPYLLSMTPGAVSTCDAGAGIGYTSIRVRGTDGTRIN
ncbi:MAG: TonB-dependent receptor, partial [Bacteroidaceae bacterium]|nr:TonB-dependent receptor [Bacteroidaceae bacterium]